MRLATCIHRGVPTVDLVEGGAVTPVDGAGIGTLTNAVVAVE